MKTITHFQPRNDCHLVQVQSGHQVLYASSLVDTGEGLCGITSPRGKGCRTTITFTRDSILAHFEASSLAEVDKILTKNKQH